MSDLISELQIKIKILEVETKQKIDEIIELKSASEEEKKMLLTKLEESFDDTVKQLSNEIIKVTQ